jgi:hypothetical protein
MYEHIYTHLHPPKRPHVCINNKGLGGQFINQITKEGVLWDISLSKPVRVHCSANTMLQVISTDKEETEYQVFMTPLL